MKVYVLAYNVSYEGYDIIGVYSSKKKLVEGYKNDILKNEHRHTTYYTEGNAHELTEYLLRNYCHADDGYFAQHMEVQ